MTKKRETWFSCHQAPGPLFGIVKKFHILAIESTQGIRQHVGDDLEDRKGCTTVGESIYRGKASLHPFT